MSASVAGNLSGAVMAAPLHRLRLRDLWSHMRGEKASFWALNVYLFFEYVRPQSIYTSIDVLPWGIVSLGAVVAAFTVEGFKFKFRSPIDGWLLAFLGVIVASSLFAYVPAEAYENLYIPITWVLVYFLITNIVVNERRLFVFMIGFLLYSFKMSQHGTRSWAAIGFQFREWGTYGAPGWFQNSGEFGIQMTIFFPLALYLWLGLRREWPVWKSLLLLILPVTALIGMVASSSRGAMLGGATVGLWMLLRSRYKVRGLLAIAGFGLVLFAITPPEQKARLGASGSDGTSVERLEMWKDGIRIAMENPVLGIGYWNWIPYRESQGKRRLLSHNIFIQCVSELGFVGLAVLLVLIGNTFRLNHASRKRLRRFSPAQRSPFLLAMAYGLDGAMVGFLTSGFFVTVLFYPFLWINLALTASLFAIVKRQAKLAAGGLRRVPIVPLRTRSSLLGAGA